MRTLFPITIFLGAFLLFLVQPLIGKYILPWFGGSPAVWTTCMLFFQVLLLGGYLYAHLVVKFMPPRVQMLVHLALMLGALCSCRISPDDSWKPTNADQPALRILQLLLVSLGIPYFVLSSTGPLLQAWFSRLYPGQSPYRLYALSNLGSLLALVSYPFVVEPAISRTKQAAAWSIAFAVFVVVCGACATIAGLRAPTAVTAVVGAAPVDKPGRAPSLMTYVLWLALPVRASALLLAITNQVCQDIAVIPFLWIAPLGIYLLTFIITFQNDRFYSRPIFIAAIIVSVVLVYAQLGVTTDSLLKQIATYCSALFVCCMFCHGEVVRLKPHPKWLTAFYLCISIGGALGGAFVALVAPIIFTSYFELQVSLIACLGLMLLVVWHDADSPLHSGWVRLAWPISIVALAGVAYAFERQATGNRGQAEVMTRNFYGVLSVNTTTGDPQAGPISELRHGRITHGLQFKNPERRHIATSYYGEDSGGGLALRFFPPARYRRVGLIGLGAGTLAVYGQKGDVFRFYEIDPEVQRLAESHFTFLSDSAAEIQIALGDARLSLESEQPQNFDVLLLDAFSGDAIPVHLLTKEAFEIYLRHLRPDGLIAVHISNRYLDLAPVVRTLAAHFNLRCEMITALKDPTRVTGDSTWMMVTSNAEFFTHPSISPAITKPLVGADRKSRLWTDDETNLFEVLK